MGKVYGKMKAALLYGPSDLRIEEIDVPKINEDEVLIRVRKIGVCPSDVRSYLGIYKRQIFPYGPESYGLSGHEWTGEIVEVGSAVKDFSVGDKVVPEIIVPCGICKYCRKGLTNLCKNKQNIVRGYAEYAKAPAKALFKVPENISFEEAAFAEPIAVCLHANEIISPKPGDVILIIGGGPMGLIHLQISKLSGAKVIVSEIIENRLKIAEELKADATVNPMQEDLIEIVKKMTDGYGVDAIIVATGNKTAIESAFKVISAAGTIVLFGGTYPPVNIEVDPNIIHYGEINVTGSYDHLPTHVERGLNLLSGKKVNVKKLISHTLPLEQLKIGFDLVMKGTSLKIQIEP
ncbi:MAG: alcohol dehydrogenase catalytic domain-containing protein [Nitrososphaeria archaeon]